MRLHEEEAAFRTLLLDIQERTGFRADIIEKDYYVTLVLKELSGKQERVPAYFKGGTALYKALGSIRRFSEDIDLTVSIDGCSNTQAKKRLENVTKEYQCLTRNREDPESKDVRNSITTIYNYDSVVEVDQDDELHRFKRVKIEATSFTVSEPHVPMMIAPMLFDVATAEQKQILTERYLIKSFSIETITLERIFVDKMFAAEFYYLREEYFDVAKHLYDLVVLLQNERIQTMRSNKELLERLVSFKRSEERRRLGSGLADKPFREFNCCQTGIGNKELIKEFENMQKRYVFNPEDVISVDELDNGIVELAAFFNGAN